MGTRSTIAIERDNGKIAQVYCHWDGYLDHNGKILQEHYNSADKIEQLIALGDISSLREEIGEKHHFDTVFERDDPRYRWTRFYGRDRNERDCEARVFKNYMDYLQNGQEEEYNYLFRKGEWTVKNKYLGDGARYSLVEAFEIEAEEQQA